VLVYLISLLKNKVVAVFAAKGICSPEGCVTNGVATPHAGYIHKCTKGSAPELSAKPSRKQPISYEREH
jgi:hypothetical protein